MVALPAGIVAIMGMVACNQIVEHANDSTMDPKREQMYQNRIIALQDSIEDLTLALEDCAKSKAAPVSKPAKQKKRNRASAPARRITRTTPPKSSIAINNGPAKQVVNIVAAPNANVSTSDTVSGAANAAAAAAVGVNVDGHHNTVTVDNRVINNYNTPATPTTVTARGTVTTHRTYVIRCHSNCR